MGRARGPRPSAGPGGGTAGWVVLAICWLLVALAGLLWGAARLAAAATGGTVEPFGTRFADAVLHGRTAQAWPHTPTIAVAVTALLLGGGAAAVAVLAARATDRPRQGPR